MASPIILLLTGLLLLFFAANAILFMVARMREANRDQKDKQAEERISDDDIDGLLGPDH